MGEKIRFGESFVIFLVPRMTKTTLAWNNISAWNNVGPLFLV